MPFCKNFFHMPLAAEMRRSDPGPLVSVLLTARDAERFIREALESVQRQTHARLEILVRDDGSSDGTARVVERMAQRDERIQLVRGANVGIPRSRNELARRARGEYLAHMDADDVCHPERIAVQTEFLIRNPRCLAVGGQICVIDAAGRPLWRSVFPTTSREIEAALFQAQWAICHPTVMMRRADFLDCGGYHEDFVQAQDYELWLRLLERGELANVPDCVLRYRQHPGSATSTKTRSQIALAKRALEEAHARRTIPIPAGGVPQYREPPASSQHMLAIARRAAANGFRQTAAHYALRVLALGPGRRSAATLLAKLARG